MRRGTGRVKNFNKYPALTTHLRKKILHKKDDPKLWEELFNLYELYRMGHIKGDDNLRKRLLKVRDEILRLDM